MPAEESLKHILEIDLTTASFPVGTALLKFCTDNKLSYSLHGGETVAPRTVPEKAPAVAAPKRKAKPAKRTKAPPVAKAQKAKPAKKAKAASAKRDRTIKVTPEEEARVIGIVRDLDKGDGVMTEAVYKAIGKKDRHWQAVLATLRTEGKVRDNGKVKRALRLFAPGVEHPTTGQTLTRKPRVKVRDAKTKAPKREIVFDPAAKGAE